MYFPLRFTIPVVLIIFTALFAFWSLDSNGRFMSDVVEREKRSDLINHLNQVKRTVERLLYKNDFEEVQKEFRYLGEDKGSFKLYLLSPTGKILSGTEAEAIGSHFKDLAVVKPELKSGVLSLRMKHVKNINSGTVFSGADGNTLWGIFPVQLNSIEGELYKNKLGIMLAQKSLKAFKDRSFSLVQDHVWQLCIDLGILTIVLGVLLHLQFTKRIRALVSIADDFKKGNFLVPNEIEGKDEIAHLAGALERMGLERRVQEKALEESREQYKKLFNQVSKIIAGVSKNTGDQFFISLVKSLSTSLGFRFVVISEIRADNSNMMSTLAVGNDKEILENFTYEVSGTPYQSTINSGASYYSEKVAELFPQDEWLRDNNIETYVGFPLKDNDGKVIGVLAACHDAPVKDLSHTHLIFPLFSVMAEAEMERQRYEKAFFQESALVSVSKNIAVASNDLSDMGSILRFSLRKICEFIKWPVGHFYLVDDPMKEAVSYPIWFLEDEDLYREFRSVTNKCNFKRGEGLPGRVMVNTEPTWISNLWGDPNFPRHEVSKKVGLRSGMAIPIMVGEEVGGVMEFFTNVSQDLDCSLLDSLAPLGAQLGRVLERARSESLLKKQALVLDQIHDAVISLDGKYGITAWNKGAERVFGFEEQEMLGKPITCIFYAEENILKQELIQPAIVNGWYEKEMEAVKKSGDIIHVHISLSILCDQKCVPQSIICYALDITEKKYAQDQLELYSYGLEKRVAQRTAQLNESVDKIKESRDQVEGILKSIGEGLLVTDDNGKLVLMNPAAEKFLGLKKEDVQGHSITQVLENQSLLACWEVRPDDPACKSFDFELGESGRGKGRKFARGSSTLLLGGNDEIIGTVVVIRDITYERKVDHLKSQFLSTAAHELRTPLTSLQGFSEILLNKQDLDKNTKKKYLQYINEESLKLATIINDFLDISRIESGKGVSLNKRLCSVLETIDRSMHIFDGEVNGLHKFEFVFPSDTITWRVDQEKVEQVLKNIYSNAIKYSPNGGSITTTVRSLQGFVEIIIEDEGLGMSPGQLNKIYDRFYRGDNFDADIPGSGLGMTIVKYILDAHGGKISVESIEGEGTHVTFNIPC